MRGGRLKDFAKAKTLFDAGLRDCEIAKECACHPASVWQWRMKNDLLRDHERFSGVRMKELRKEGKNMVKVYEAGFADGYIVQPSVKPRRWS